MIVSDPRVKVCSSGEEAELLIPPHLDLEVYPGWLSAAPPARDDGSH